MKNVIKSFGDISKLNLDLPSETKNLPGDKPITFGDKPGKYPGDPMPKEIKGGYTLSNIGFNGAKFYTKDGYYETYRDGHSIYWMRTMIGEKNGASDIDDSQQGINSAFLRPNSKDKAFAALIFIPAK